MSMHEIEAYIETAIVAVAQSNMSIRQKRDMIYSLFAMEEYGDCGFTNRRTLDQMIACKYTFVFDKEQMYDYEANRDYYDGLAQRYSYSQGDAYAFAAYNPASGEWEEHPGRVCVDSGSEAWKGMVAAGAITGEGAEPVERLDDLEVLRTVKKILQLDDYLMQAHAMLFVFSDAIERLPDEEYPEHFGMTRESLENLLENGE